MTTTSDGTAFIRITGISGEVLSPGSYPAHELAELLRIVEDIMLPIIREAAGAEDSAIRVCLTEIRESCVGLRFRSNPEGLAKVAEGRVAEGIRTRNLGGVPRETASAIMNLRGYARNHGRLIHFPFDGEPQQEAVIGPDTDLGIEESAAITGHTTIYGILANVGGVKPTIVLQMAPGRSVHCRATEDLVKQIGARIYDWVGVTGVATWKTADWSIETFVVDGIARYVDGDARTAMDALRSAVAGAWDGVQVDEFMRSVRGD